MTHLLRTRAWLLAAAIALQSIATLASAAPNARSALYSGEAVLNFCSRAQQITASTALISTNVLHTTVNAFTFSSAAPYEGPNLSAYNGKGADGGALGLTTQSFVSYRELGQTGFEFPVLISCKMKAAEAINFHLGAGSAGAVQRTCRDVNQSTVADVYASLTLLERRVLRWAQSDIVFLNDIYSDAGPVWLYPLPYLPVVAFINPANGKLHFIGRSIWVERTNPTTAAGPDKKGSYYCHLPSPEYVRALITGQIQPIIETVPE